MRNQPVMVTVVGWAGNTPKQVTGEGVPYSSFRVSARERRYDSRSGQWVDGRTEWFTVKAFRDLALNLAMSVRSGDPVVVTGRLRTEEWQGKDGPRTSVVIEADAIGHDLALGQSRFARIVHRSAEGGEQDSAAEAADPWAVPAPPGAAEAEHEPVAVGAEPPF